MRTKIIVPALLAALVGGSLLATDSMAGPHHRGDCGPGYSHGRCDYGPGYYHGRGDGMGWGHYGHPSCWGYYRNLPQEKRDAFAKIVNDYSPRMEALRDQIFVKRQELKALQNATNPDVAQVRQTADELVKLHNQMADLHNEMGDRLSKEVGSPMPPRRDRGDRPAIDDTDDAPRANDN